MKKLIPFIFVLLFLVGCSKNANPTHSTTAFSNTKPNNDMLWEYALPSADYTEIIPTGNDLYLLTSIDKGTSVEVFSLRSRTVSTTFIIPNSVSQNAGTLQISNDAAIYYDLDDDSIVQLNSMHEVSKRFHIPCEHIGNLIIAPNMEDIYYTSNGGIFVYNLKTEITKQLKSQDDLRLEELILGGKVLKCLDKKDNFCYFYTSDGHSFVPPEDAVSFSASGDTYLAEVRNSWEQFYVAGLLDQPAYQIKSEADSFNVVAGLDAVIATNYNPGATTIAAYDIKTGIQLANFPLKSSKAVFGFVWHEKLQRLIYFTSTKFDKYTICMLDLQQTESTTSDRITIPYYSSTSPDAEGIAQCSEYVKELCSTFKIDIQLSPDFRSVSNGCRFQNEYRSVPYQSALALLSDALKKINALDLEVAAKNTPSKQIHIGLFHKVINDRISINHGYFWNQGDFYIALSNEADIEDQLYHALGIFLESRINSNGSYFDYWDNYNPYGFTYYPYFDLESEQDPENYSTDCFVSRLSIISPTEDRAEVFRAALNPENKTIFKSYDLHRKLSLFCDGLCDIFDLDPYENDYPWDDCLDAY